MGKTYLLILSTMFLNGYSHVYILITLMLDSTSLIILIRLSEILKDFNLEYAGTMTII